MFAVLDLRVGWCCSKRRCKLLSFFTNNNIHKDHDLYQPKYTDRCTGWLVADMFVVVFRSLTIMLVVVSSYSILTTFPRFIGISMNLMNIGASVHQYLFYRWAVNIIAPWNYCGNFFFYVLSGKQFRKELAMLFCCRRRLSGAFVLYDVYLQNVL